MTFAHASKKMRVSTCWRVCNADAGWHRKGEKSFSYFSNSRLSVQFWWNEFILQCKPARLSSKGIQDIVEDKAHRLFQRFAIANRIIFKTSRSWLTAYGHDRVGRKLNNRVSSRVQSLVEGKKYGNFSAKKLPIRVESATSACSSAIHCSVTGLPASVFGLTNLCKPGGPLKVSGSRVQNLGRQHHGVFHRWLTWIAENSGAHV